VSPLSRLFPVVGIASKRIFDVSECDWALGQIPHLVRTEAEKGDPVKRNSL
jgi:hypothetical protein